MSQNGWYRWEQSRHGTNEGHCRFDAQLLSLFAQALIACWPLLVVFATSGGADEWDLAACRGLRFCTARFAIQRVRNVIHMVGGCTCTEAMFWWWSADLGVNLMTMQEQKTPSHTIHCAQLDAREGWLLISRFICIPAPRGVELIFLYIKQDSTAAKVMPSNLRCKFWFPEGGKHGDLVLRPCCTYVSCGTNE